METLQRIWNDANSISYGQNIFMAFGAILGALVGFYQSDTQVESWKNHVIFAFIIGLFVTFLVVIIYNCAMKKYIRQDIIKDLEEE